MEKVNSTDKWAATSMLTDSEMADPMLALTRIFMDYELPDLVREVYKLPGQSAGYNLIIRIIEASLLLVKYRDRAGFASPFKDKGIHPGISTFLVELLNMLELRMKVAKISMDMIMETHEMKLFAIKPEIAYFISTFRMIVGQSSESLKAVVKNLTITKDDFSFLPTKDSINLALFVDEVTAPFRLYEETMGKILEITNTLKYSKIISTDIHMVNIVVTNLLHLGFYYATPGQLVSVGVHSDNHDELEYIVFSVRCNCEPIHPDLIGELFQPVDFLNDWPFTYDQERKLYLSQKIISELRGSIHVISNSAETVFTAKIPVACTN
ncbi:hypothetical protein [Chitinophaga sp. LS1]|uniref:hypothetical protein n=1 Tax=Chitinophaga sp. LS1 TaxID=3051176 RepID=UPI002AAC1E13|nr:hypothetical protein [Chitinophaga sp. LS1]WPV70574.1 hypothetical protein QQL36_17840 [Chitinophaga sp. LS1]